MENTEFYFTLDLGNHQDEQLFHVDANGPAFEFALVGIIVDGNKQAFADRYTLRDIKFLIRNFDGAPQKVKLDRAVFNLDEMTNTYTSISIYTTNIDVVGMEEDWIGIEGLNAVGVRRTILDVHVFNRLDQNEQYQRMNNQEGFGGHICKSRYTF